MSSGTRQDVGWEGFDIRLHGMEEGVRRMLLTSYHSCKNVYGATSKCSSLNQAPIVAQSMYETDGPNHEGPGFYGLRVWVFLH